MDFKQILEWIKLSGKQAFVLCLLSSIFLFSPESIIEKLGLTVIKVTIQPWLGVVWLLSVSVTLSEISYPIYNWLKSAVQQRINLKKYQKQLHNLSSDEKDFLIHYLENETITKSARISDGVANSLVATNIIYRASTLATYYDNFQYNIQPWAYDYLKKHPECLSRGA